MKKYIHEHYHFVIAVVALLSYTVFGGLMNNISSLYLVPVSDTLGVTRTSVSLTSSARSIACFLANMSFGLIYGKFGFRKLCTIGLVLAGLAFFGLASAQTILTYGIFSVLIGICDPYCNTTSLSKLINEWFESHRGLVLGLVTASSGIGGSLFSVILTNIITTNGWRMAHTVSGIALIISGAAVLFLIRTKPSDIGLEPFKGTKRAKMADEKVLTFKSAGLPFDKLRKTPAFYLMMLSCILTACVAYAPFHILIAHLTDNGLTQNQAAQIWSIMYLLMALMKILDGFFSDLVGARIVLIVSSVCCGLSCFLYADVTTFSAAIFPTVLLAMGLPLTSILQPLSVASVLGMRSYDSTVGIAMGMAAVASLSMGPVMNALYEKMGSYQIPMKFILVLSVISVLLYVLVCRLADKDRKSYELEEKKKRSI